MQEEVLKNGLTQQQVQAARDILKQVRVSDLCQKREIKAQRIYNILRGTDIRVEVLQVILQDAIEVINLRQKALKELPAA